MQHKPATRCQGVSSPKCALSTLQGTDEGALDYGLDRALDSYYNDRAWFNSLAARVMRQDWSWNRPAIDYIDLCVHRPLFCIHYLGSLPTYGSGHAHRAQAIFHMLSLTPLVAGVCFVNCAPDAEEYCTGQLFEVRGLPDSVHDVLSVWAFLNA